MLAALSDWALTSLPDEFWFFTGIAMLASACGFFGGFYFFIRSRVLADTPTSRIRSAAQGYLELAGRGQLLEGPPIIAPLTGTHCTWYSYRIEEHRGSGKNSKWVTIEKGDSDSLFLIVDDTGKCVIDPEGATVIPSATDTWYGHTARPTRGRKLGGRYFGGRFRYREMRMHPGDELYAIGLYKTVGGASTEINVNQQVAMLLKEWKADSRQMLQQYDHNKDGQIDIQEWQAVRDAALKHVLDQHKEIHAMPPVNIMGNTMDARRPFILSAVSQEKLIGRYYSYAGALLVLFFLAGAFASWAISLRLYGGG
jgi:hypothetical protein